MQYYKRRLKEKSNMENLFSLAHKFYSASVQNIFIFALKIPKIPVKALSAQKHRRIKTE
jgi:hypothetical protein